MPENARPDVYRESRKFVLRGLALLFFGCVLLLTGKLPLPEPVYYAAIYAGGIILLFGNGCIIFGLLVYAGDRQEK
ncbi:hypothetical protein LJC26_02225 [Desulfovibrio sp. OttesenSCG-928-O18]|nr:hypothetical protein [Desulfovibrio sp. OttesenSCG-928-O18]